MEVAKQWGSAQGSTLCSSLKLAPATCQGPGQPATEIYSLWRSPRPQVTRNINQAVALASYLPLLPPRFRTAFPGQACLRWGPQGGRLAILHLSRFGWIQALFPFTDMRTELKA